MGGRGSSSGLGKNTDGVIVSDKKRKIESSFVNKNYGMRTYKDKILEAQTGGKGNLTFDYAYPTESERASSKRVYTTYELRAGAVNGSVFNVNLDKAKTVSGQTYDIKEELKRKGFKWNSSNKRWER